MKATRAIVGAVLVAGTLAACGGGSPDTNASATAQAQGRASFTVAPNIAPPWLGTVNSKSYDGDTDDLLTGGFGKSGLAARRPAVQPADCRHPQRGPAASVGDPHQLPRHRRHDGRQAATARCTAPTSRPTARSAPAKARSPAPSTSPTRASATRART